MPSFAITNTVTTTQSLTAGQVGFVGTQGGIYQTSGDAVTMSGFDTEFFTAGDVFSSVFGVDVAASSRVAVTVTSTGSVLGSHDIASNGVGISVWHDSSATIANNGMIGGYYGIRHTANGGGNFELSNGGHVSGVYHGINLTNIQSFATISNTGTIESQGSDAIHLSQGNNATFYLSNTGDIIGGRGTAIQVAGASTMKSNIINTGNIIGNIHLGLGDDVFDGRGGVQNVYISLFAGNDLFRGGDGAESVHGGTGSDTLVGYDGDDSLDGGDARDIILGMNGDDNLIGGDGDDLIRGGSGDDSIDGGGDNNDIRGGSGEDTIETGSGDDTIKAGKDDDIVDSGDGADVIFTGSGHDLVNAGVGKDIIVTRSGADTVIGGDGDDTVIAGDGDDQVTLGKGSDAALGGRGDDTIEAGKGHDTVGGGAGNDVVTGGDGNDQIDGGEGNDQITGGSGNDTIAGNIGHDLLKGGGGADEFYFIGIDDLDLIEDFTFGTDKINFENLGLTFAGLQTDAFADLNGIGIIDLTALGWNTIIHLDGVDTSTLSASDFILS
ncbi:calcium-binding protein [Planktotalea sp.]|uniref:calcium-binding protein n=1 Tax=Planktotalea sp. TaxID=2029877 RepID=UPI003D6A3274